MKNGMAKAFVACGQALNSNGRLVLVFAHKHPDAWETLVSAVIRAGFRCDGSWPYKLSELLVLGHNQQLHCLHQSGSCARNVL